MSDGTRGNVLVTSRSFGRGSSDLVGELERAGLRVVHGPTGHAMAALAPLLQEAKAWICGTAPVTAEHLRHAKRLRVLARHGVGVDNVDRAAADALGIPVANTPGANSAAVADLAVGLLLASLRGVAAGDRDVRAGHWRPRPGRELGSLTLGIAGFGRIGRSAAARVRGFGCTVLAHDPAVPDAVLREFGAEPASLEGLAANCDAVTLHVPGGERVVGPAWLDSARPGLFLVNTARADAVDEEAVAAALRSGTLAGYAADTLASEHGTHEGHADPSPLLAADLADRVVVTPHSGAQTVEAIDRMGAGSVHNVLAVLDGRTPPGLVPAPAHEGPERRAPEPPQTGEGRSV